MKGFLKGFELAISQELPGASGPLDPRPGRCPGPTGGPAAPSLNFQYFENFQLSPMYEVSKGHIFSLITMKLDQHVCLDEILHKFENGSCRVKN